ncbi:hypothetical protein ABD76_21865 [Paenibacillus dendritiformis]|nr:hypothetical protein [Paenibacillus dendritiformis]
MFLNMSDVAAKMGQKIEEIDKNVQGLSICVAKLETEITFRFEQTDKTLQGISSTLADSTSQPLFL